MSKAFTKESEDDGEIHLPDREVSAFPNLVTAEGLAQIEAEVDRWAYESISALVAEKREEAARAERELRYWTLRRNTAQLQPPPPGSDCVYFGSAVNIIRPDGRRQSWRIVGEDEADPLNGRLSYASPLARAMMGKGVGEVAEAGGLEAKIVAISV